MLEAWAHKCERIAKNFTYKTPDEEPKVSIWTGPVGARIAVSVLGFLCGMFAVGGNFVTAQVSLIEEVVILPMETHGRNAEENCHCGR